MNGSFLYGIQYQGDMFSALGLILKGALHDPRQVFPSVRANDVADARRQVKHASLRKCARDEFFNVVTSVPVRN